MEEAKLRWCNGDKAESLTLLHKGVDAFPKKHSSVNGNDDLHQNTAHAVAKLLIVTYSAETMVVTFETNMQYFKDSIALCDQYCSASVYFMNADLLIDWGNEFSGVVA